MRLARLAPAGARRWLRHWPLLPGLAVAVLLRAWGLFPAFLFGDEAEYAAVAQALAHDWRGLSYPAVEGFGPAPFVSQPPLVLYLFAGAILATGSAEVGPLLVSAALGTATVALVYALGVRLADRWLGGLAALLLAVLPVHVSLSRGAQLDAGFTFFVVLAMLAAAAWLDRPTRLRALLAGLAVAAACLAKLPGVLVLAPIGLVLLGRAAGTLRRAAGGDKAAGRDLGRLGRHLAIAAAPVAALASLYVGLLWHLHATRDLAAKLGWQAGRVAGPRAGDVRRGWGWYFTDPGVGLPALLGLGVLVLAAAGLLLLAGAAWRGRRGQAVRALMALWPACFLAFFMLSGRKEWFYLAPVMPALALLAAWAAHRAWLSSLWPRGVPLVPGPLRRRAAVAAVLAVLLLAGLAPAAASVQERVLRANRYGAGVKEAALWIGEADPGAAQVGSLLGRFALHLYNGQPTYHYFVNHTFVEGEAEAGRLRYVVRDPYLNLSYERAWMQGLVERFNGTLALELPAGGGRAVQVYRLHGS